MSGISGITITATGATIQAVTADDDALLFTANGQSANGITVTGEPGGEAVKHQYSDFMEQIKISV